MGISVDTERMLQDALEINDVADALAAHIAELENTVNDMDFGRDVLSLIWGGLYSFFAGIFEEAIRSHYELLRYAYTEIEGWAKTMGVTEDELKAFLDKLADGITSS